ncbi:Ca(2+)-dependent cysteine protease [Coelomomyces lativittatus]|nr:Ca(2+)-dependent cysteine protease [Coelomomyces lativittatus]
MDHHTNSKPACPTASYHYNSQTQNPSFSDPNSNNPVPLSEPSDASQSLPVTSSLLIQEPAPFTQEKEPNPPFIQPYPTPSPSPLHTQAQYDSTSSSHLLPSYPIETVNGVVRIKGRKKALLVGINYTHSKSPLRGCIKDVMNVKSFLINRYGFQDTPHTMATLTDDQTVSHRIPTRKNIITAMQWLVAGAAPGDSLFFHFSGHGGQQRDFNGDEEDNSDETILPLDFQKAGMIVDDEIHAILVKPLPPGVRLTALFDSCHSGTAMDLPYVYLPSGELKKRKTKNEQLLSKTGQIGLNLLQGNKMGAIKSLMNLLTPTKEINPAAVEQAKKAKADVIQFSGCKDQQTSADACIDGQHAGAMSWALLKSIESQPSQTYAQILTSTRGLLSKEYSQIPQLSSGSVLDMNQLFIL